MAIGEVNRWSMNFKANGAITKYTMVKLSTLASDGSSRVATTAASTDVSIGVAQETVADGDQVSVMLAGISLVSANGAHTIGDELMVITTDGEVDTWTASAGSNAVVCGVAMETAAAAQDQMAMLIKIYQKQG